ncbi:lytic transglycosylase domain-containing protein [Profundibacter sp.]|uniref:lytic transglycosylase domain-containing protein n=1 Tax=Profundibacter sp. TaxID=3101071 RepID=UPI003D143FBF
MARIAFKRKTGMRIRTSLVIRFVILTVAGLTVSVYPLRAAQDLSQICDQAAAYAARETGVPLSVLQAISLNETGRKRGGTMRPWPWTVNMEGKGVWFDTEDEARAFVYQNYKRGARSFDVGCFQINYKWHGQAFASIEEMFKPRPNALYAAKFLLELYREKGDWGSAAGAYHSRTPKYAEKYEVRFNRYRKELIGNDAPQTDVQLVYAEPQPAPAIVRINKYPLLQSNSTTRTLGSLVPLGNAQSVTRLIIVAQTDG